MRTALGRGEQGPPPGPNHFLRGVGAAPVREFGRSGAPERHAAFWLERSRTPGGMLPREHPGGPDRTISHPREGCRSGSIRRETRATAARGAEGVRDPVDETLLAAIGPVHRPVGRDPTLRLDSNGTAAKTIFDGVDLSRTVGWFTTLYPVVIELEASRGSPPSAHQGQGAVALGAATRPELRRCCATWGRPNGARSLRGQPQAEIASTTSGSSTRSWAGRLFRFAEGSGTLGVSGRGPRPHLLGISARVAGGRLRVDWSYGE